MVISRYGQWQPWRDLIKVLFGNETIIKMIGPHLRHVTRSKKPRFVFVRLRAKPTFAFMPR